MIVAHRKKLRSEIASTGSRRANVNGTDQKRALRPATKTSSLAGQAFASVVEAKPSRLTVVTRYLLVQMNAANRDSRGKTEELELYV